MRNRGVALDKLLIAVISVSVAATGLWNSQAQKSVTWADPSATNSTEIRIKAALDDIKYHLRLAGYKVDGEEDPLTIERGTGSEILKIRHNGVCFEYSVDSENNLIRRVESRERAIAENVSSIQTLRTGENTLIVTISCAPRQKESQDEIETLARSYSVVVEMKNLI